MEEKKRKVKILSLILCKPRNGKRNTQIGLWQRNFGIREFQWKKGKSDCTSCRTVVIFIWDCQDGRRLALSGGTVFYTSFRSAQNLRPPDAVRPSDYIETRMGIWERRAEPYGYFGTDCSAELRLDLLWNRILFW